MGGFVIVDDDRRWAVSNWVWREVFERVVDMLPRASDSLERVRLALRGGIHYLDLSDSSAETRAEIETAVSKVRRVLEAEGERAWVAPVPLDTFLRVVDDLVAMLRPTSA